MGREPGEKGSGDGGVQEDIIKMRIHMCHTHLSNFHNENSHHVSQTCTIKFGLAICNWD